MKKLTLLAAMAVAGISVANAQYVVDPSLSKTNGAKYDAILLDQASIDGLTNSGKVVQDLRPDDTTKFLYVWDGTFVAGDGSYPGVDMQMDGYTSLDVASVGWSGASFCMVSTPAKLSHISDDTHLHIGFRSTNKPTSVAFIVFDGYDYGVDANKWSPAKFSVGSTAFNDNGTVFPLVGNFDAGGDWAAVDITLGQLKKLWPAFSYKQADFGGNILAFLAGGVTGTNICLDAVYFYSPEGGAVDTLGANNTEIVVTSRTISAPQAKGISLYNTTGQLVKEVKTSIMGIEGLASGVYVVRAGNAVKKVVLK